jgi:hypothetical protein
MPGELTTEEPTAHDHRRAPRWRRTSTPLGVLVAGLVVGALAGVVWERLWTPPSGLAYQRHFYLDGAGLPHDVDGTGLFVLVGVVAAALLGLAVGLVRGDERILLIALLAATVLAAVAMTWVGHRLGPDDPRVLARTAADRTPLPGDLRVVGSAPYLAWPVGGLVGYLVMLVTNRRDSRVERSAGR